MSFFRNVGHFAAKIWRTKLGNFCGFEDAEDTSISLKKGGVVFCIA